MEEPRWHTGHFTLKDNGKPVRQLRMEKAGSQTRPVILVVDLSGSMTGVREKMARSAVTSLVEMLPDHQRLGLITHSYGTVRIAQDLVPKREGKVVENIQGAIFWSTEQILPATLAALEMADEPATIISLTDGEDSMASRPEYLELLSKTLQALRETDSTFIHVGIGEADPVLMNRLADASGTSYLEINDPERLPDLYSQLGSALSGNVELSYVIPEDAEPGTTRELTVEMEGYKGTSTTSYEVKEGTPFGLVRIEVNVSGNPDFELNRTLVDFTDGYDGWRMMTKASLWVSPSVYPPHIVESRRVDEWIEALLLADFAEGSDLDHNELNRSFSFRQGSTLNRIRAWHSSISPNTPLPLGPTVWMMKESLRIEGEDIVKRSDLDWVGGFDWPESENREELAKSFLGLLSAEGIVWGGESVNSHLLANTGSLVAYPPGATLPDGLPPSLTQIQGFEENSVIVVDPENPSVGWRIDQETGGVYGYVAHGHEIAKGATLEETAA
ncbi:MAG: vWA domain-containing protein, partial [Verrucomicrobiota bacterium]